MKTVTTFCFLFFISLKGYAYTILIDPGHGGEDEGATTKYYYSKKKWKVIKEKDLALSLAKKIHTQLKKRNFKSYLTRSVDRTVTLAERADLAEKIKADLFISVHINSSAGKKGRGFETYYLDNHNDSAIKKVEEIENKDLKGDALVVNKILTDLVIERTVKSSKGLANSIHYQIQRLVSKKYKLRDRGVKPGLFYVLALTKRPAILLEVGFLSNSKDLKKILNPSFQMRYAKAVAVGISNFIKSKKKTEPALL